MDLYVPTRFAASTKGTEIGTAPTAALTCRARKGRHVSPKKKNGAVRADSMAAPRSDGAWRSLEMGDLDPAVDAIPGAGCSTEVYLGVFSHSLASNIWFLFHSVATYYSNYVGVLRLKAKAVG